MQLDKLSEHESGESVVAMSSHIVGSSFADVHFEIA